jgi:hypothetical protein
MQARKAVVLSLGMLFDSVDAAGFIGVMIAKAKAANAEFEFNQDIKTRAFELAERYNRNEESASNFQRELLELLGIKEMSERDFIAEWNKMIVVGKIAEKISELQAVVARHNVILYLASDTNVDHLLKLEEDCSPFFSVKINEAQQKFAEFPLYTSCYYRKNRTELLKLVVGEIQKLQFNKSDEIRVVLGDPKNVTNQDQKRVVQAEYEAIAKWGAEHNIKVDLHNKSVSIAQTLEQMFAVVNTVEQAPRMAMS